MSTKPEHSKVRSSEEYAEWRHKVYVRDNFTCRGCGQIGGNLHAHHIKKFSEYKDLRLVVSNGVTLCFNCHAKIHRKNGDIWNLPKTENVVNV